MFLSPTESQCDVVARHLRRRITSGRIGARRRLPSRHDLAREYNASLTTIQAAIERLTQEGFVRSEARKSGTFVVDHPPHLHHYRIVFPHSPTTPGTFWQALHAATEKLAAETDNEFSFFYGLSGHHDMADYREVVGDVLEERVAGLILASGALEFQGTPVLEQPNVPRIALASHYELPGIPKLSLDLGVFLARAIDHLLATGCRRIGVLLHAGDTGLPGGLLDSFKQAMAARGLAVNPLWVQCAHDFGPIDARHVLHLMLHAGQVERPDGLILTDDNCLAPALQGMADAGVRPSQDLAVVALANFPLPQPGPAGITRLGFDVPALLARLVAGVDALRNGESLPELTPIAPLFSTELDHHD